MLTYTFTNIGSDSLYEHLYKCIKSDILQGKLVAGERLPSKRPFAKNLGISVITVENAYEQLIAEGYIYSIPKRGFYVADLKDIESLQGSGLHLGAHGSADFGYSGAGMRAPSSVMYGGTHLGSASDFGCEDLESAAESTPYLADFSSNQTDSRIFPFTVWAKTMRELLNENQEQLMINPPCGGIFELRTSICDYLREFRGMHVNPEQIIIGAETEYLYSILIQLLGNDMIYGLENPGYPKLAKIYKCHHVPYRYIDMDEDGISASALEAENISVIHISPSHHFPTGIVTPVSRRYELLGWAARKPGRYIIEDDYDSELRLAGKPIPTLQSIDVSDHVIYINTFTKTLSSTVRIGYMILPKPLAEKYYEDFSFYSCTVSNFEQYTLAKFMANGSFEKHINRLRNYYQIKRDAILSTFRESPLKDYIQITEEESGVHFLMHIDTSKSEKELIREALEAGIRLAPLSDYYSEFENHGLLNTYVMNYSSVNLDNLERVAENLYKIVK